MVMEAARRNPPAGGHANLVPVKQASALEFGHEIIAQITARWMVDAAQCQQWIECPQRHFVTLALLVNAWQQVTAFAPHLYGERSSHRILHRVIESDGAHRYAQAQHFCVVEAGQALPWRSFAEDGRGAVMGFGQVGGMAAPGGDGMRWMHAAVNAGNGEEGFRSRPVWVPCRRTSKT